MSIIKKSDVKNHLSAKRNKRLLLFRPMYQPNADTSGSASLDTNLNVPNPRQASGSEPSSKVTPITPVETATVEKL